MNAGGVPNTCLLYTSVVGSKVTDEIKALEQPGSVIIFKGFVTEE